jgi:hypothetical protein
MGSRQNGERFDSDTTGVCWDSVIHELGHVTSGGRTDLREGSSASVCEEPREFLQVRNLRFIHLTSFNSLVENCIETVLFCTIILEFNVNQAILNYGPFQLVDRSRS